MRNVFNFVIERKNSFTFTLGSMFYGFYHFFNPNIFEMTGQFEVINLFLKIFNGRHFGMLFIIISSIELYGIIFDNKKLRIHLYFILLFLWILLATGLFVSFLQGNINSGWITAPIIAILSTNIISTSVVVTGRDISG